MLFIVWLYNALDYITILSEADIKIMIKSLMYSFACIRLLHLWRLFNIIAPELVQRKIEGNVHYKQEYSTD